MQIPQIVLRNPFSDAQDPIHLRKKMEVLGSSYYQDSPNLGKINDML
jgi:hypothetical protein